MGAQVVTHTTTILLANTLLGTGPCLSTTTLQAQDPRAPLATAPCPKALPPTSLASPQAQALPMAHTLLGPLQDTGSNNPHKTCPQVAPTVAISSVVTGVCCR
jgi:hypothetical protein